MATNQKTPKVFLKKCNQCNKPVQAVFYKKGDLYNEYICLENAKTSQFHVFKVKSDFLIRTEMAEAGLATAGGGYVLHDATHKPPPEKTDPANSNEMAETTSIDDPLIADVNSDVPELIELPDMADLPQEEMLDCLTSLDWTDLLASLGG